MKKAKASKTTLMRIDSRLKRRMKIEAAKQEISMVQLSRLALEAFFASKPGA